MSLHTWNNPFILVFTPFQHQQGVLMFHSRHHLASAYFFMLCSFFLRHSLSLPDLFISLFARLSFVSTVITEVFRNEEFQYLLYQFLHAISSLIIKKSFILVSSQVVTVMAVLDSSDSKVISTTLTMQADLLLLAFFQVLPLFINSYSCKGLLSVLGVGSMKPFSCSLELSA